MGIWSPPRPPLWHCARNDRLVAYEPVPVRRLTRARRTGSFRPRLFGDWHQADARVSSRTSGGTLIHSGTPASPSPRDTNTLDAGPRTSPCGTCPRTSTAATPTPTRTGIPARRACAHSGPARHGHPTGPRRSPGCARAGSRAHQTGRRRVPGSRPAGPTTSRPPQPTTGARLQSTRAVAVGQVGERGGRDQFAVQSQMSRSLTDYLAAECNAQ